MCLIHEAKLAISSELVLFHLTQQVLNVIILIIICTIHKLPSSKHAQNDTIVETKSKEPPPPKGEHTHVHQYRIFRHRRRGSGR